VVLLGLWLRAAPGSAGDWPCVGRVYHRPGGRGYQALYPGRPIRGVCPAYRLISYAADASDPTLAVLAFPTPAYDPDLDRFELTAKGEAYLSAVAEPPPA
jgi:hypothetical protein